MHHVPESHPLRKLFAGMTEYTFLSELGVADTKLIDYLAELLTRFLHRDRIYALRDAKGQRLEVLAAMLEAAERPDQPADVRRENFRHIGDFTLFWTGVYPEAIATAAGTQAQLSLQGYSRQGKRSYYLASTYLDTADQAAEAPVLRRLSEDFELCAFGLRRVRQAWEASTPQA